MASLMERVRSSWNVFRNGDDNPAPNNNWMPGASFGIRPDRPRLRITNERTIVSGIYTRVSMDVAAVNIRHVRLDDNDRYIDEISSGLNNCLTVEANIDQAARHFRQDAVLSLFEEGVIAIVPVDTSDDPNDTGSYDIKTLRVGKIVQWYPRHVRVSVYDDRPLHGRQREILVPKSTVAIVENPLYNVMNEPNSTLQRLVRKLSLLDAVDEQSSSGRLDLIIQLPYVVKSDLRKQQAEERRKAIEEQLQGSQYGIAYTDGTEKITQLNRSAENNLLKQVEYLTNMLYGQLGITEEVLNGTADEKTMLNYYNRTVEPILAAISEAMIRVFLTPKARTQKQSIIFMQEPFKLVPMANLAEMADKFTRNEILTSNEIRGIMGFKPSKEAKADMLVNSNIPQATDSSETPSTGDTESPSGTNSDGEALDALMEQSFSSLENEIDEILGSVGGGG